MARERYKKPVIRREEVIEGFSYEANVAENSFARLLEIIVNKIVEANPEKFFTSRESIRGTSAYSPIVLIKLLIYGYFNRIASSRRLEAECYRNIEVIWLLEGLKPDHWTINHFRTASREQIEFIAKQFRQFLFKEKYIDLEVITIDGFKLKANSKREVTTLRNIDQNLKYIDKRIQAYMDEVDKYDELETLEEERLKVEEEKLRVEEEKLRVEEEKLRVEEEKLRVEKEAVRVKVEKDRLEEERLRVEEELEEERLRVEEEKFAMQSEKGSREVSGEISGEILRLKKNIDTLTKKKAL